MPWRLRRPCSVMNVTHYYCRSFEQKVHLIITTITNPTRYSIGMSTATLIGIIEMYQNAALLP